MKTTNEYAQSIGRDVLEDCPKQVFAAIAVSALTCGGDYLDEARDRILKEWWVLHHAGIVPQKPPSKYSSVL